MSGQDLPSSRMVTAVAPTLPPPMETPASVRWASGSSAEISNITDSTFTSAACVKSGYQGLLMPDADEQIQVATAGEGDVPVTHPGRLRQLAIRIVEHSWFEGFIMVVIAGNVLTLALHDPLSADTEGRNFGIYYLDIAWTSIFTLEMLLKMLAGGISHKPNYLTYLNDSWNWFDMSMVAIGWTLFIPSNPQGGGNTSGIRALRALRALRPLRTISRFDSLREILECFFAALPLLASVFGLLAVFLYIYSVVGLVSFKDSYHHACYAKDPALVLDDGSPMSLVQVGPVGTNQSFDDPDMFGCGHWEGCPSGFQCMNVDYLPPVNTAGYDDFGHSLLTTFQALTLTGWSFMMYRTMDSSSPFSIIYFLTLVIIGAYFVMNLFIAVLKLQFDKARAEKSSGCKHPLERQLASKEFATAALNQQQAPQQAPNRLLHALGTAYNAIADWFVARSYLEQQLQVVVKRRLWNGETPGGVPLPATLTVSAAEFDSHLATLTSAHSPTQLATASPATAPPKAPFAHRYCHLQFRLRAFTDHAWFNALIGVCAAGTVLTLAAEYDGMPTELQLALIYTNYAFVCVFVMEVALKWVAAGGLASYLRDAWNVVDLGLTVLAAVEMIQEIEGGVDAVQERDALRVIRALRVLRGLKAFKLSPGVREIGAVLINSAPSFSAISLLVLLFWIVFSIVGLNVFGGVPMDEYPNFDTFLSSMMITFEALTLENFQVTMFSVVRATNYASTLWFISWIMLGKYTFLSLFLAVVLEAFDGTAMATSPPPDPEDQPPPSHQGTSTDLAIVAPGEGVTQPEEKDVASKDALPDAAAHGKTAGAVGFGQPTILAAFVPTKSGGSQHAARRHNVVAAAYRRLRWRLQRHCRSWQQSWHELATFQLAAPVPHVGKAVAGDARYARVRANWAKVRQAATQIQQDAVAARRAEARSRAKRNGSNGASVQAPVAEQDPAKAADSAPQVQPPPPRAAASIGSELAGASSQAGSDPPRDQALQGPGGGDASPLQPLMQSDQHATTLQQKGLAEMRLLSSYSASRRQSLDPDTQLALRALRHGKSDTSWSGGHSQGPQDADASNSSQLHSHLGASSAQPCAPLPGVPCSTAVEENAAGVAAAAAAAATAAAAAAARYDEVHGRGGSSGSNGGPMRSHSRPWSGDALAAGPRPVGEAVEEPIISPRPHAALPPLHAHTAQLASPYLQPLVSSRPREAPLAPLPAATGGAAGTSGLFETTLPKQTVLPPVNSPPANSPRAIAPATTAVHNSLGATDLPHSLSAAGRGTAAPTPPISVPPTAVESETEMAAVAGGRVSGGQAPPALIRRLSSAVEQEGSGGSLGLLQPSYSRQSSTLSASSSQHSSPGRSPALAETPAVQRQNSAPEVELSGTSLGFLKVDNPFRNWLYNIVCSHIFTNTIFGIIGLNCIALAVENPHIEADSTQGQVLHYSDIVFTAIFTFEATCKIIAWGFLPYITCLTNQVDFLIVITSILELLLQSLPWFHALRVLRALKPLRALTHSEGMRQVMRSVLIALTRMGAVTGIVMLAMLMFAVLGVQLFNGRFWSCSDGVSNSTTCTGTYIDGNGDSQPREWTNLYPNFDNIGNALIILFIGTTTNGYGPYMIAAMAAPSLKGDAPVKNGNWAAFLYFMTFILLCALILLSLYTGVIFSQFSRIAEENNGSAWLTQGQQQWVSLQEAVFRLKPLPPNNRAPTNPFRLWLYRRVKSRWLEYFIGAVVLMNAVVVATTHRNPSDNFILFQHVANIVFTSIFTLELVLKVVAMGPTTYIQSGWNKLDCVIVALALVDLGVSFSWPTAFTVMHVFALERAIRVLKLAQLLEQFRTIKSLYTTFIVSAPAFMNIGSLIFLLFFVYAYIGVLFFAKLQYGGALNSHANFLSWPNAMLTLIRFATGDAWSDLWIDMIPQSPPRCDESTGPCGSWLAVPYIVSFMILVFYIFLNLFMAVIIESYEHMAEMADWTVSPQMLDELAWAWVEYDDGSGTIEPHHFPAVLFALPKPLGLGHDASASEADALIAQLNVPLVADRLPFHATAFELVRRLGETKLPENEIKSELEAKYSKLLQTVSLLTAAKSHRMSQEYDEDGEHVKAPPGRADSKGLLRVFGAMVIKGTASRTHSTLGPAHQLAPPLDGNGSLDTAVALSSKSASGGMHQRRSETGLSKRQRRASTVDVKVSGSASSVTGGAGKVSSRDSAGSGGQGDCPHDSRHADKSDTSASINVGGGDGGQSEQIQRHSASRLGPSSSQMRTDDGDRSPVGGTQPEGQLAVKIDDSSQAKGGVSTRAQPQLPDSPGRR